MNFPTLKTLSAIRGADHVMLRKIGKASREHILRISGEAHDADRRSYHPHNTETLRMIALDEYAGTHGVEHIQASDDGVYAPCASYLNTGESYAPTIIFWNGRYRVQSIGDFIETMERRGVKFD